MPKGPKCFRKFDYDYTDIAFMLGTTVLTAKRYGQGKRRQFSPTDIRSVFRLALQRQRELDMKRIVDALCQMVKEK